MSYDDWPDNTLENRRAAVRKTIRPATIEELTQLSAKLFPVASDPWVERFNSFLKEHSTDKFYHAQATDGYHIIYCRDAGRGIWYLPGLGVGIIQQKGLDALAGIVDAL